MAKVRPFLDKLEGITGWEIDLDNPDKILTIKATTVQAENVMQAVRKTGFLINKID